MHGCVLTVASMTCCQDYWLTVQHWLVMKGGSAILTLKSTRAWNGLTHLQRRKGLDLYPQPEELQELSYGMLRDVYWYIGWFSAKISNVHFVKCAHWERLSFFNMMMHNHTLHSDIANNYKEWLGSTPTLTIQSGLGPHRLPPILGLSRSQEMPALQEQHSPGNHVYPVARCWNGFYHNRIFKLMQHWQNCVDHQLL